MGAFRSLAAINLWMESLNYVDKSIKKALFYSEGRPYNLD